MSSKRTSSDEERAMQVRRITLASALASALITFTSSAILSAQEQPRADTTKGAKVKKPWRPSPLFTTTTPLDLTLTVNLRRIMGDRDTTKRQHPLRAATLTYRDSSGASVSLPAEVRVRGIWRLQNC